MKVFILRLDRAILVFTTMVDISIVYKVFPKTSPTCGETHKSLDYINSFVHLSLESVFLVITYHEDLIVPYISCSEGFISFDSLVNSFIPCSIIMIIKFSCTVSGCNQMYHGVVPLIS